MEHRRLFPNDEDERKNYFDDTFGTRKEKKKKEKRKQKIGK